MSLIEGIGDEVTNFYIIVITAVVLYFAWRSTNVRDERLPSRGTTVNIYRRRIGAIDVYRRRLLDHPEVIASGIQAVTLSILRSESQRSNISASDSDDIDDNHHQGQANNRNQTIHHITEAPTFESVIEEVSDLATGAIYPTHTNIISDDTFDEDTGPEEIIRDMDRVDSPNTDGGVRQRRRLLNDESFSSSGDGGGGSGTQQTTVNNELIVENVVENTTTVADVVVTKPNLNHQDSADKSANTENCTNENCENGNVIEDIPAITTTTTLPTMLPEIRHRATVPIEPTNMHGNDDEFRIKLKYINDDLKLVKGTPNEAIGDFKKRNFTTELSNQKLVKLVFKGHVLQPDTKTLQACGLFDNCVVHCLVHNQRPNISANNTQSSSTDNMRNVDGINGDGISFDGGNNNNNTNHNINNGQRLVYFGIFMICVTLAFVWYFRIQYYHLFTWYSTIGLFLLTALSLVIIPLLYLIEREVGS